MALHIPGALLVIPPAHEELASAIHSFLPVDCKRTVLQCVGGGGIFREKGLGQAAFVVKEQAVSLTLLSSSDLKNNLAFVRLQKLLSSERQHSHLFSWRARAYLSAFLLQAHS